MNKRSIMTKAAILSMGFIAFGNSYISPAMAVIGEAFPDVSRANIQLIMTFGLFGSLPMTFITGWLADRFRAKSLSLVGTALMIVGGVFPLALHGSIFYLYMSNLMMGAGGGMLITLSSALIPKLFPNAGEQSRLFGLDGAFQNAGSMIMMFAAGVFAATQWYNVFWGGFFFVPTLFIIMFFLPKDEKPQRLQRREEEEEVPQAKGWDPAVYPLAIYIALFSIVFATVMINSAMLLDEQLQQGSAVAGTIASVTGFISIFAGVIYKNIADVFKQHMLGVGGLLLTIGVFMSFIATNVPVYFIGFCLVHLGFTLGFTGGMHGVARVVAPEKITKSMALFMGCQALGSMVCPYIINPIADAFTGVSSALGNYQVTSVFGIVVIIFGFVWGIKNRRYYLESSEKSAQLHH